ncbi:hypothetical protein ACQFX6_37420 [Streptomyces sp. DSM 41987]|uniref:hypothetical protein n=1 Tax=Streptomyces TaxID=1883 RepID=UPI0018DF5710|nr:hypothetical protein [Streptomyces fildesensis]
MKLRTAASAATTTLVLLALASPAVAQTAPPAPTAPAAAPAACAKEQLAYLTAEDQAMAAAIQADTARKAADAAEKDVAVLKESSHVAGDLGARYGSQGLQAGMAVSKATDARDAAATATALKKLAELAKSKGGADGTYQSDRLTRQAALAQKATKAKNAITLNATADKAELAAMTAVKNLAKPRTLLESCLKKASA